jgi:uncharacterized membrane protein (UPF0182 family)
MTIGITGPRRRAPWRSAVVGLIIAAAVVAICLILLGLTGNFVVDWLWFSAIGYLDVFWTMIVAEAVVFFAVFVATAAILWVNGLLATRFARSWTQRPADFEWKRTGIVTFPDVLEVMRRRLPWPLVIAGGAGVLAMLVAWGEGPNWGIFLRFLYHVPYGGNDPLYDKDIGFYLFALPAYIVIKNWMLLTLLLSALFAGAVYWIHGDIEYDAQRRSMSPTAIAHGSVLLGFFFVVKAWSYGLDRYLLLYHDNGGGAACSVVADRAFDRRGIRLVGELSGAWLPASRGSGGARLRRLLRAVRRGSSIIPALVRQTRRTAAGEALHRTQHRLDPAGL